MTHYWIDPAKAVIPEENCELEFLDGPGLPLWLDEHPALLSNLNVARARGGSAFRLKATEWTRIAKAARCVSPCPNADTEPRPGSGQGRATSAEERREIELLAMTVATEHYERLGYAVADVSSHESYDLRCSRGESELHVEVKGTRSDGRAILLTANEVEHAHRMFPHVALVVVGNIELDADTGRAYGGTTTVYQPFDIREHAVSPTQFRCSLGA